MVLWLILLAQGHDVQDCVVDSKGVHVTTWLVNPTPLSLLARLRSPALMRQAVQSENGTKVLVGPENVSQELKDSSVVMTKFDIGDGMQGLIGVVGPTRMDYAKVTARLSYFAESLSKAFAKPETKQLPQPNEAQTSKEV